LNIQSDLFLLRQRDAESLNVVDEVVTETFFLVILPAM
jgi:hypothetical protein